MANKIDIPVQATLDTHRAETAAKRLGKTLRDASQRVQLIPDGELAKLERVELLWQRYLAVDRQLARGLARSGQAGLPFAQVDFGKAGASPAKSARIAQFVAGGPMPTPTGQGLAGVAGSAAGAAAGRAVGGGAGGGSGGAGGLLGGAAGGAAAGVAGLLGGIAAIGVSKLVGAAAEGVAQAEKLNIDIDRLKRTLGDVNVSFAALKRAATEAGNGLKLTYDETTRLATNFSKAGNLKAADYKSLPAELGVGVGMSRAFGMDPDQGVGFLGSMRGVGVTQNVQESRRMAMLVGETIAKSDAFAKADEVMSAIAGFATAQTRQTNASANVAGYAGMFAGMVSSGIPGLDPTGAAGLLSKVNSTLAAGGGKGEASQFLTARLGASMGMDVFDTQAWRENGAFATPDSVFSGDSAIARYYRKNGLKAPSGSQTHLSARLSMLKQQYKRDPKMLLNAVANDMTGGNMNSAAALLGVDPKAMGELEKALGPNGLSGLNASGIGNAALAVSGTDADRRNIANGLLGRSDLKDADRRTIQSVMADGSQQQQKEVLAKMSAQYEQERTDGQVLRDSKAMLENIKVSMADKVVPLLSDARSALIYMAGGGKKSIAEIEGEVNRVEAKSKLTQDLSSIGADREALAQRRRQLGADVKSGKITQDQYVAGRREIDASTAELDRRAAGAGAAYRASTGIRGCWWRWCAGFEPGRRSRPEAAREPGGNA